MIDSSVGAVPALALDAARCADPRIAVVWRAPTGLDVDGVGLLVDESAGDGALVDVVFYALREGTGH